VRQLEAVKARRDALAADVAQKRSVLGALEAEIAKLRAAAQKVQQQFSITPPGPSEASRLAGMLPSPLYLLHAQLSAAIATLPAGGPVVARMEIMGGKEEAKAADVQQQLGGPCEVSCLVLLLDSSHSILG
jgi:hypothetical protein